MATPEQTFNEDLLIQLGHTRIKSLELSKQVANRLTRAGIITIADLTALSQHELYLIHGLGVKSLAEIQNALHQALNSPTNYMETPCLEEQGEALQKQELETWTEIIEPFLKSEKETYIYVLISRFGFNKKTLAEIAAELKLTPERVRQLEKHAADSLIRRTGFLDSIRILDRIIEILSEDKEDLSLDSFKSILNKKRILGKFSEPIKSGLSNLDPFELLIIWLDILSDSRITTPPRIFPIEIGDLRKAVHISIRDYRDLQYKPHIPRDKIKKLLRKVAYTGGVHLRDAMKILSVSEQDALWELKDLNLCEIRDRWFSAGSFPDNRKRLPLIRAGAKMLSTVEEMEFSSFYDGLRRHAARFFDSIAPQDVVLRYINLVGFEVKQNIVSNSTKVEDTLSKTERCLVDAIRANGHVATFKEIVEAFRQKGFSRAAVTALLAHSPVPERVDVAMYKIRGSNVPGSAIENAKKRQRISSKDI